MWNIWVPVDGKAVGPWSYDMTENSTGAQATLNIECVSPYRVVGGTNHYLLNDKDASKMCRVTLSNEDGELIDPLYIKFYQSGMMDVTPARMHDGIYYFFIQNDTMNSLAKMSYRLSENTTENGIVLVDNVLLVR